MNSVSIVIPVFNSELSLPKLLGQLAPAMEAITTSFEVILVDDCSRDDSWDIIKTLQAEDSRVQGIRLSRNYGQHNALLCGIRAAQYEVVVTMDDDLQNPVSEIQILLDKLDQGFDVVYGAPNVKQHGFFRNLATRLTKFTLRQVMGAEVSRNVSAFRAFRMRLRDGFENFSSPYVSIDVLLSWTTSNFASVLVRHEPRTEGVSNYTFGKLVAHSLDLMTGFSVIPLRVASVLGFTFTVFGALVLFWVVGRYLLLGTSVAGFPFLASIIALFSGVQLFSLGIFGEYLARIHFRTMNKTAYNIRETAGLSDRKNRGRMDYPNIKAKNIEVGVGTVIDDSAVIRGVGGEAESVVIGDHCYIGANVQIICDDFALGDYGKIHHDSNIHGYLPCHIGHNAWIGQFCIIDSIGGATIGHNCGIGAASQLWSHIKYGDCLEGNRFKSERPLEIGNDVWFVGHCIVSPIHAADRSMAMVGAVVTVDMAFNSVYAGVPAKDITAKVGPQFAEVSTAHKLAAMKQHLADFAGETDQIRIVKTVDQFERDDVSYFAVESRQYQKTSSKIEVAFMQYLLPDKAKFVPLP